nr:hypothetical protein [Tanacetum cinerariifolium]
MKWYNYDYLEEIEVQREDQQLYKFKEGDFPRIHLHDIEDMLLLLAQKKLFNLKKDVIFDLGVTDVYQTYYHSYASGRLSTGSQKLPEEAQHHQSRDIQDGLLSKKNMEYLRHKEVSHHHHGYRSAAAKEKVNEQLGKVRWWERLRERPQTA